MTDTDKIEEMENWFLNNHFKDNDDGDKECREIFQDWLPCIRQQITRDDPEEYRAKLWDALFVLTNIRDSLKGMFWLDFFKDSDGKSPPRYSMYAWPNEAEIREWGAKGTERAGYFDLNDAFAEYLRRPWLQHDAIDVSGINAILVTELSEIIPPNGVLGTLIGALGRRNKPRLLALYKAWQAASTSIINPSQLKELVLAAEKRGVIYPPLLHSLIDGAITRRPHALIRKHPLSR